MSPANKPKSEAEAVLNRAPVTDSVAARNLKPGMTIWEPQGKEHFAMRRFGEVRSVEYPAAGIVRIIMSARYPNEPESWTEFKQHILEGGRSVLLYDEDAEAEKEAERLRQIKEASEKRARVTVDLPKDVDPNPWVIRDSERHFSFRSAAPDPDTVNRTSSYEPRETW